MEGKKLLKEIKYVLTSWPSLKTAYHIFASKCLNLPFVYRILNLPLF